MISPGTGYKAKDVENLDEGETLMIGSKEIEVMGIILEEDFKSGKCFQSAVESSTDVWNASRAAVKPFCNPLKNLCNSSIKGNTIKGPPNYRPRHDPYAPSEEC